MMTPPWYTKPRVVVPWAGLWSSIEARWKAACCGGRGGGRAGGRAGSGRGWGVRRRNGAQRFPYSTRVTRGGSAAEWRTRRGGGRGGGEACTSPGRAASRRGLGSGPHRRPPSLASSTGASGKTLTSAVAGAPVGNPVAQASRRSRGLAPQSLLVSTIAEWRRLGCGWGGGAHRGHCEAGRLGRLLSEAARFVALLRRRYARAWRHRTSPQPCLS